MATTALLRVAVVCSVIAFILMFIAFASPYWYKSWTRVHSSFGRIGLWHVCLNGYIKPRDPVMKSYVGCWWIHSTEFSKITDGLQPVWFRFIQAFSVFALIGDLVGAVLAVLYIPPGIRGIVYKKRPRTFFIASGVLLVVAFLVLLIALVFAKKSNDSDWMPRPWMNYLSWSYGLCVLSGFFSAFAGMCLFVLALVYKDKEDNGDPGVTSAAELAARNRELEKQDEIRRFQESEMAPPHYGGLTHRQHLAPQKERKYEMGQREYGKPPSVHGSVHGSQTKIGESFV